MYICLTICGSGNYVHFWQKNEVSTLKIALKKVEMIDLISSKIAYQLRFLAIKTHTTYSGYVRVR